MNECLLVQGLLPMLRKRLRLPRLEYISIANQGDYMIEVPTDRSDIPRASPHAPFPLPCGHTFYAQLGHMSAIRYVSSTVHACGLHTLGCNASLMPASMRHQ